MAGGGLGVGVWGLSSWFAYLPLIRVCVIVSVNDVRRQPTPQTWQPSKIRGRYLSADEQLTYLTSLFVDGRRVRSEATSFQKGLMCLE